MNATEKSLHWIVDKWLAPTPSMPARVTQVRHNRSDPRFVRVEAQRPTGLLSIVFFRHDDGTWNVFPPASQRLAMHAY
ncbi:MAG TPA: hypothetical protein VL424_08155 [Pararobbsia sp.]|nr:hypothetical protein [Pararobbsia sp.]